jgi:hypothetical protein
MELDEWFYMLMHACTSEEKAWVWRTAGGKSGQQEGR